MGETVIVVGAGQAAQSLVEALRGEGFEGRVALIGEEPVAPYQRPPLSKKYLLGEMAQERLFFRGESYYADSAIETRFGARVEAIDRAAREIRLASGETLSYDKLALTTGSRPRLLPAAIGGDLAGVYPVRTLADVDAMAPEFQKGRRALIVGGGYIGLEAAAVASMMGVETVLVEMAPRILARVASAQTSAFFTDLHRGHAVDVRAGVGLKRLTGEGRVSGAELADGERLAVDFVLVGVGIQPNAELAEGAGLTIDNGIAVDAAGRTSDPAIFAAGDCASFPYQGGRIRLESVQNAIDQAAVAAKAMLGQDAAYSPVPWFWSDQYDVKLQMVGLAQGADQVIERPGAREGAQSLWYFKGGRLLSVDALNDPRSYMMGKRWLEAGHAPDPAAIADPTSDLKTL